MTKYNTIIIGAGPAGIIAGIYAKRKGENILIIEKNSKIGRKLAITGKGRCNITNDTKDIKELISKYRKNGKFLFHAISEFSTQDTIKFFNELGIDTKVERGNRVFPVSDDAFEIVDILRKQISDSLITECSVIDIKTDGKNITEVVTNKGSFSADKYILATGGKSYPTTGSDGFGYELAKKLGHTIIEPKPALTPVDLKESWISQVEGLSLKHVQINIFQNEKKIFSKFGEMIFTHKGISGPIVIDCSREIGDLLENGSVKVVLDLKPALDFPTLKDRLNNDLNEAGNKCIKNSLDKILPKSLIPVIIDLTGIDPEKKSSQLSKEERNILLHSLKEIILTPINTGDWYNAIVTDGGISIKEIDPNTMRSKVMDNLYFAGEIIDVYGPTGGYNLQQCWSTGYLAGIS